MNVLLVDDDPEIRLLAGHLLRAAGHDVAEAEDSASATAALDERTPDVLLMDVMLGDEDGVEVAAALFRSTAMVRPRLIFLTASTLAAQVERMQAAGAAGILQKPFDPATFVQALDTILAGAT